MLLKSYWNFEFYKNDKDIIDWVNIHFKSGEFTDYEYAIQVFHDYYDYFENELNKRCIFVLNEENEEVGTGTISLLKKEEYVYDAVVDWVAIKKKYQVKHLSRPLISQLIKLASELGHKRIWNGVKMSIKVVTGGVIEKDGKFLLVQENKKICQGKWNLPAGGLDDGESVIDGAIREIYEETGCKVEITGVLEIINEILEGLNVVCFIFDTKIIEEKISVDGDEISNVK